MGSTLFPPRNNLLMQITRLKKAVDSVRNGNADALARQMENSNPTFAQFVRRNRGKSAQQILRESGINTDQLKNILDLLK